VVIDSSALLAILLDEPDAGHCIAAILSDGMRLISAVTFVEASIVIFNKRQPTPIAALDASLVRLHIRIVSVDEGQALLAREASRRFEKGRDKAGLNFGDCFSYALAKQTGEPLLFKGNDFTHTDLPRVTL
jgi:ribonuclease VapC